MKTQPARSRNPLIDWYSPYFGPTTLLVAAAVLIASVQIGRYVGSQTVVHDVVTVATPAAIHVSRPSPSRTVAPKRKNAHTGRPMHS